MFRRVCGKRTDTPSRAPSVPEDAVTMAQPQGVDMSKLSPAEKEAMMQQVFANATTVRPRTATKREGEISGSRPRAAPRSPP